MNLFKNLAKERNELVMRHAHGRLLDIGCGKENYIENHRKNSIGIDKNDVFPSCNLFDTVTMVASFNYMTRKEQNSYLNKAYGVLMPLGKLLITCVTPKGSWLKFRDGEVERGINPHDLIARVESRGFTVLRVIPFNFGFNNLYVFVK